MDIGSTSYPFLCELRLQENYIMARQLWRRNETWFLFTMSTATESFVQRTSITLRDDILTCRLMQNTKKLRTK